jgi:hypothetical protein
MNEDAFCFLALFFSLRVSTLAGTCTWPRSHSSIQLLSSSYPAPIQVLSSSSPAPLQLLSSSSPAPLQLLSSSYPAPLQLLSSSSPAPLQLLSSSCPAPIQLPIQLLSSSYPAPIQLLSSSARAALLETRRPAGRSGTQADHGDIPRSHRASKRAGEQGEGGGPSWTLASPRPSAESCPPSSLTGLTETCDFRPATRAREEDDKEGDDAPSRAWIWLEEIV